MRPTTLILIHLVSGLWSLPSFAEGDWPTYMHDSQRSGATTEQLPAALARAWTYPRLLPPGETWQDEAKTDYSVAAGSQRPWKERTVYDRANHVAVAAGRVFLGSASEHTVVCLDAVTGERKWLFFTGGPVRMAPTYAGGKIYVGSDDGSAYCLDADDGSLVWKATPAGSANRLVPNNGQPVSPWAVRSGILVENGTAYYAAGIFPAEGVHLVAADAATGSWTTGAGHWLTTHTNKVSLQGYLLLSPSRVFVPGNRSNPAYFNRATGAYLGQYSDREAAGAFALLAGDSLYFGHSGRTAGRLAEGNATASDVISTISEANALVVSGGVNYILFDTKITAKRRSDGVQLWSAAAALPRALILAGSTLYAGGKDKVAAFDAATGAQTWQAEVRGEARGLAVASGKLFVSTSRGLLYAFAPESSASTQNTIEVR
jgi:outer membrane protein assembly factor BamB